MFKLNQIDHSSAPVHFWLIWYGALFSPFLTRNILKLSNFNNIIILKFHKFLRMHKKSYKAPSFGDFWTMSYFLGPNWMKLQVQFTYIMTIIKCPKFSNFLKGMPTELWYIILLYYGYTELVVPTLLILLVFKKMRIFLPLSALKWPPTGHSK